MEVLGVTAFRVITTMAVLLVIWLIMGQRQIAELSPFDFAISITIGTVAGANIADTRIDMGGGLIAIILLGLLQILVNWLTLKYRSLQYKVNFEPLVMVENGQILRKNLRKARLSIEMLLQLLREKDVFNITEVELAVLEPHGKLSVLKKAEFLPLKPNQLNIKIDPNRILVPVILEGELQEKVLKKMGFSSQQIETFHGEYKDKLDNVFVAFMDKEYKVYITKNDFQENGVFLH